MPIMRMLVPAIHLFLILAATVSTGLVRAADLPGVFAAYATPLEEPWNQVIHQALERAATAGRIRYSWQDQLATPAAMTAGLQAGLVHSPKIIVADGTDALAEITAVADAHHEVAFLVGTDESPVAPNLSVFESDLAEPAYLCGVLAGRLTKSGVVGVVAGRSDEAVHHSINAYAQGARHVNPAVRVKVAFINSWYDPPKAKQAALKQIADGADLIWAEREGAIEAACERGVLAFGNLVDQHHEGPGTVITGPVWSMVPLVEHAVTQAVAGEVRGENYTGFSSLARGGAVLAPWHGWDKKIPADIMALVEQKRREIESGILIVTPSTARPVSD
jgi:basic membrane protein A and related proteins